MLINEHYSSKCDIFSLGVVLFQMIYGSHPFFNVYSITKLEMIQILENGKIEFPDIEL